MWKNETPEVRELYHIKSLKLKRLLLTSMPTYKYTPRRPEEIRRRRLHASSRQTGPQTEMPTQEEEIIRSLFPGTVNITADKHANATSIRQHYGAEEIPPTTIPGWVPTTIPANMGTQGLEGATAPPIDQVAIFGQVVPTIDFTNAYLLDADHAQHAGNGIGIGENNHHLEEHAQDGDATDAFISEVMNDA